MKLRGGASLGEPIIRLMHLPAGSSVANMSLLGYDPIKNYTGRAPLEAAAQGIELGDEDWCVRCNLVTVQGQTMNSFTAGHISSEEAKQLLSAAQENVADSRLEFIPGVSYRNLMMFRATPDSPAPFSNETRATRLMIYRIKLSPKISRAGPVVRCSVS